VERPEVVFLGSATGRFDMLAEVVVKDQDDLREFLGRVRREVPQVTETEPIAFLRPRTGPAAPRLSAPEVRVRQRGKTA
jgi:DNA-binding Lrp family transcriptional regulator